MPVALIVLLVIIVVVVLGAILFYNGLVRKRNTVDESYAQVEVQLKRRHDLVPNLVNAVKDYMSFEQDVLTKVTEARANAVAAGSQGVAEQASAENMLTGALRSLFAVAENYPTLKASENTLQLQEELTTTENQLAFARQFYNDTVMQFNMRQQVFPSSLVAGFFAFKPAEYFTAPDEDRATPHVDLSLPSA